MNRKYPPVQFVFSALTIYGLITFFVLLTITHQPWLGVVFTSQDDATGLFIQAVRKDSPAENRLHIGQQVLAIEGLSDRLELSPDLLQAPDRIASYQALNHYLKQHERVSNILAEPTVTLLLADGEAVSLTPESINPLRSIQLLYFAYLVAGFFCMSVGLLLWHYRPQLFVTRLILAAGFGSLFYFLAVVLQYRELALPGSWLLLMNSLGLLGVALFAWGQVAIFMVYPIRLMSNKIVLGVLLLLLLAWVNSSLQLFMMPLHAFMMQFPLVAVLFYYLLYRQWQSTRSKPVERAVIRLFILCMVIPTAFVVVLWMVPVFLQRPTGISHDMARLVFVPVAAGWALAVFRYQLFNVEQWWFKSTLWMASGVLVLILDVAFIYLLGLEAISALGAALIIAGFFYFPLRQLLLSRLLPITASPIEVSLSLLLESLQTARSDHDFQQAWQAFVEKRFNPAQFQITDELFATPIFREEGLLLLVPDILGERTYQLSGKNQGNGLFNQRDVEAANSMLILAQAILNAARVREEATMEERTRVMRDLHDSLGAKLLSMAQRAQGSTNEEEAREALQTLRDTVHLSTNSQPIALAYLLGDWRMETRERLEIVGVELRWNDASIDTDLKLGSAQNLLLRSFLREGISNALKHAAPQKIQIHIEQRPAEIQFSIVNDGQFTAPEQWKLGFGLTHLRDRLLRAGGDLKIRIVSGEQDCVELKASLPIGQ